MKKPSTDEIIQALNSYIPDEYEADSDLQKILNGLDETENPALAIPAMFELMEKFPEADLGSPGILVHLIEKIGEYDELLIKSVQRVPTNLNLWMVNRILNSNLSQEERMTWLELLKSVHKNQSANVSAKKNRKALH